MQETLPVDPQLTEPENTSFHSPLKARSGAKPGRPKGKGATKLKPIPSQDAASVPAQDTVDSAIDSMIVQLQSEEANGFRVVSKKTGRGRGRPRKTAEEKANGETSKSKKRKPKNNREINDNHDEKDAAEPEEPPQKRSKTTAEDDGSLREVIEEEPTTVETNVEQDGWPQAGPLIKKEQAILDGVMKQYRESKSIEQRQVNAMIQNTSRTQSEQTKELWSLLYESLPQRPHVSVMRATRRRYHNYEIRGKWSGQDDEDLKRAHDANPGKWVKIGSLLSRMPEDCRDRWRNYLRCGDDRRTDDWKDKEEEQLSNAVMECMNAARQEAKDRAKEQGHAFREQEWETFVNFNNVSEKMGYTRSRLQCYTHWKVMQKRANSARSKPKTPKNNPEIKTPARQGRALAKYEKMTPADKFNIVSQIKQSGATTEDEINWKAIRRRDAANKWSTRDRKETFQKMKELVPPQESLQETIEAVTAYLMASYAEGFNPLPATEEEEQDGDDDDDDDDNGDDFDMEGARVALQQELDATPNASLEDRSEERARVEMGSGMGAPMATVEDLTDPDLHLARTLQGIAQLSQAREEALRQTEATEIPTAKATRKKRGSKKT